LIKRISVSLSLSLSLSLIHSVIALALCAFKYIKKIIYKYIKDYFSFIAIKKETPMLIEENTKRYCNFSKEWPFRSR